MACHTPSDPRHAPAPASAPCTRTPTRSRRVSRAQAPTHTPHCVRAVRHTWRRRTRARPLEVIARSHAYGALPNNLADPRFPIAREKPLGPALKRLPRSPLAPLLMRRPSSSCPHDEVRPRQRPALGGSPRPAAASAASAGGLERSARPDLVVPNPPSQVFEGMSARSWRG